MIDSLAADTHLWEGDTPLLIVRLLGPELDSLKDF